MVFEEGVANDSENGEMMTLLVIMNSETDGGNQGRTDAKFSISCRIRLLIVSSPDECRGREVTRALLTVDLQLRDLNLLFEPVMDGVECKATRHENCGALGTVEARHHRKRNRN